MKAAVASVGVTRLMYYQIVDAVRKNRLRIVLVEDDDMVRRVAAG